MIIIKIIFKNSKIRKQLFKNIKRVRYVVEKKEEARSVDKKI